MWWHSQTKNCQLGSATLKINNITVHLRSFLFIILSFIICILSKIVGFDQLWTQIQQKLVKANKKLVSFKIPNTLCRFIVQNYHYISQCGYNKNRDSYQCSQHKCLCFNNSFSILGFPKSRITPVPLLYCTALYSYLFEILIPTLWIQYLFDKSRHIIS